VTPREATRYLESRAVFGMRFGLERMRVVLGALGDPHRQAPAIHVVGTNGKSSTTRFAAAALRSQGLRVGSYVSPHVDGWHERIMVDEAPVDPQRFADAIGQVANCAERTLTDPQDVFTQFEVLTAAAFVVFADAGVDAMVVEAGLGGRFDATNVFDGTATVALTGISLEHTAILGDTERAIADEKLAVVLDGSSRLVVGPLSAAADEPVHAICAVRGLDAWFVGEDVVVAHCDDGTFTVRTPSAAYEHLQLGSMGGFQIGNAATAVAAVERRLARALDPEPLRSALAAVRVPGRLEVVAAEPIIILDGAHNPDGMQALARSIRDHVGDRTVVAVVSIFSDKDIPAMCAALATFAHTAVVTRSTSPRAEDPVAVAASLTSVGVRVVIEPSAARALVKAGETAGARGAVVVCGSLALLADIRNVALQGWSDHPGMLAGGNTPEIVKKPER
jgi:dihydrofolate synthase/folylpolyglutamate synthase